MTTNLSTRPRVPRGVPSGGEFTATRRFDAGTDILAPEDVLEAARASARYAARRTAASSVDDLTSEILLSYCTQVRNQIEKERAGIDDQSSVRVNPRGTIHTIARRIAPRVGNAGVVVNSKVASAFFRYRQRVAQLEADQGSPATIDQQEEIAEKVRLGWPADSRPPAGFHRMGAHLMESQQSSDPAGHLASDLIDTDPTGRTATAPVNHNEFADGSLGAEALANLEHGSPGWFAAAAAAWNVVSPSLGAPPVANQSVSEKVAARSRKAIAEVGGARAAVRQWRNEELDDTAEKALFAPFGGIDNLSFDDKDSVCNVIEAYRGVGDSLWQTALGAATIKRGAKPK